MTDTYGHGPADGRPRVAVVVRAMTREDLPGVRRVERVAYPDSWSRRVFEQELHNAFAQYVVAEDVAEDVAQDVAGAAPGALPRLWAWARRLSHLASRVSGFAGVWFMGDQLHVVTIAVDPRREGGGLGARLLLACLDQALASAMQTVALEVRVSNARARALYERYGFNTAGRLRGYYDDNGEDALVMVTPELRGAYRARIDALRASHRERFPELWREAPGAAPEAESS